MLRIRLNTFPFGYRAPCWLHGDKLIAHFMDFIDRRFKNPVLTHACFEHRLDPTAPDAAACWARVVAAVTELCEGINPITRQFEEADETTHLDA